MLGGIALMTFSSTTEQVLFGLWGVGSLLLAGFVRRRFYVYFGSVALSAPIIGYIMLVHGLLPAGGIIHALCAGLLSLPIHYLSHLTYSDRRLWFWRFAHYLSIVHFRRHVVLGTVLLGVIVACIITARTPPVYASRALVYDELMSTNTDWVLGQLHSYYDLHMSY
jgi:hypothetical protein